MKLFFAGIALFVLIGCSQRSVYEGVQAGNRNECYSLPPTQQEECFEKNSKSYEQYERERKEIIGEQ